MSTSRCHYREDRPSLDTVQRRIEEISSLPQIAVQVMKVADNPNSGAADLKEVMEGDPSLSARVLRCVNSSAYALRTKITDLQRAIAFIGTKQIRNLAMVASVSEMFKKEDPVGPYKRAELWQHLIAVGIGARLIAMRLGHNNFEEIFLAGLLHDIGIILEDQHAHRGFCKMMQSLDSSKTLADNEFQHLGFDHMQLGLKVAEKWGFPEATQSAIRHHHGSVAYHGSAIDVVRCVEVANLLCTMKKMPSIGANLLRWSQPTIAALALTKDDLLVFAKDLDRELAENHFLIQMGAGGGDIHNG